MKTDRLIELLAHDAAPVDPRSPQRRLLWVAALSIGAGFGLMLALLGLNPRLAEYTGMPMFWVKFGFGVLAAAAATVALQRLARPGVRLGSARWWTLAPYATLGLLGAWVAWSAAPGERLGLWLLPHWAVCPLLIATLGLPALVGGLWLMRTMAPTRLALAGAVVGLWAGGIDTALYALYCPILSAPYLATWYALGTLLPALAGALLGRRLLRW
ncbi:MAG: DUF1109 domain-containing protein [Burkholderiales bacterium]|jgi:hypothetical protein|nr:DUF1109 domain-containing protein [Burkholderiales bacterium]